MTYEMYRYVFLGGAALAGIMLIVSVILFFAFRIPRVISDLSGRTARRAIEDIRRQNEQSGDKTYKSSPVNMQRGKLTDKISRSGRLIKREETPFGTGVVTEKISTQELPPQETSLLAPESETTVLDQGNDTTVLNQAAYGETSVLQPEVMAAAQDAEQPFVIEYEITFIHTNEVIA